MKNKLTLILATFIMTCFIACKSTYEQVRTSNDPVKILELANQYFEEEDYYKAQSLYDLVIPFYRGKKEAEDLFYKYAYTYYNTGQYILASHYFNSFSKTFYNSPLKEEMSFMSAYANYEMSPTYKLDQKPTEEAIDKLQAFINQFPNSPRVDECNGLIDEMRLKLEKKAFETGKLYYQLGNYQSAMVSFENLIKDFPESNKKEEVRYLIVKSNHLLAKNSIYEKQKDRLENTIVNANKYLKKYPKSDKIKEINGIIKYCNNELKRFVQ
ncbi:MAG: outer membrane protein assembly factor BamD [Saprospiraceae bacterium]|nr:outer membrane protein assembly factor BamD [Bacteroidia bacterium]NNE15936.1 outer membrane protein assembly factor BamD [Saprospiraceae bacterium]NNL93649.1 outer membrane protein assembly factor BamD [Saprospiraceae bacterium]